MKNKTKYYSGPDGIYYSEGHDLYYVLQASGASIMNTKGEYLGASYTYYDVNNQNGCENITLRGCELDVYLGEL